MFNPQSSDKKDRSLVEIVILVMILAILMMSFIHYFFKQEDRLTHVAFSRLAQNFSTKVTTVHAQWFMDNQPNIVLVTLPKEKQKVSVNKNGWIDHLTGDLVCSRIWDTVMMEPLFIMNTPISAIEVKKATIKVGRICRFELSLSEYFEYNAQSGKVSKVLSLNTEKNSE